MSLLFQLFNVNELRELDQTQLEILRAAIRKELQSPEVADAIRANVRAAYAALRRRPESGGSGS